MLVRCVLLLCVCCYWFWLAWFFWGANPTSLRPTPTPLHPDTQVINFYETRTHTHLHTVACMDELEGCFFLAAAHARQVLGSGDSGGHVFVTGGSRGALRLYSVSYAYSASAGKKSVFSCTALVVIPVSGSGGNVRTSISRQGMAGLPPKADEGAEIQPISGLMYLPERAHSQIVAITADQTFCCYELSVAAAAPIPPNGSKKGTAAAAAAPEAELVLTRQLVGTHDDILDLTCLPTRAYGQVGKHAPKGYQLAIASNSPHIRLTDMLTKGRGEGTGAHASRSVLLYGHADVVLALDGSPDGYVSYL